jgi:NAD(P)-dependent dehydrogenase (short-subunit alcohol dehydrogenase family)
VEVALVTGGAAGAGRAIADRLRADGYEVVIADVDGDPPVDVSDPAQLTAAIEAARPAVLVNNAGGGGHVEPHYPEASPEEWGFWLDLNLRAPMLATQVALRLGARAVVNVASSAGARTGRHVSPEYAASKAGLIRFTTALDDPRVSCLIPDWILTERAERELAAMTPEERAAAPEPIPLDVLADAVMTLIERGGILTLP